MPKNSLKLKNSFYFFYNIFVLKIKKNPFYFFKIFNFFSLLNTIKHYRYIRDYNHGLILHKLDKKEWLEIYESIYSYKYPDYNSYLIDQSSKLPKIEKHLILNKEKRINKFKLQFSIIRKFLKSKILCLGARLGEEVEAFRGLGFDAIGIDIEPGVNNSLVLKGDVCNLAFEDNSFNCVYTNIIDHVLDPARMTKETNRVLNKNGIFIVDVSKGFSEIGFKASKTYDALKWKTSKDIINFLAYKGNFKILQHYELPDPPWTTAILIKN